MTPKLTNKVICRDPSVICLQKEISYSRFFEGENFHESITICENFTWPQNVY